jgi:hypothetical protein
MRQGWNIPGSAAANSVTRATVSCVKLGSSCNRSALSCIWVLFVRTGGWSIMKVGILSFHLKIPSDRQSQAYDDSFNKGFGFQRHCSFSNES